MIEQRSCIGVFDKEEECDYIYGGEDFYLTDEDIMLLKQGKIINFDVNLEYGCTLRYKNSKEVAEQESIMDLTELYRKLRLEPYTDYIVRIRYRYLFEDKWTYDNSILTYDIETDTFTWLDDWNEGQEDVEVLGYCPVSELKDYY